MIIPITDPGDERLAPYRDIKERDLVKNQRQFVAEGKTVLQVLVDQGKFELGSLLILENRLAGTQSIIQKVPKVTPIYVVPQSVINQVVGFPMHRGVLAIGEAPKSINELPPQQCENWKRIVALSALSNHDNVGSIFRNAAAFGVDAVFLDRQCCDPLYRKAIRVSVGGVFKVPFFTFETVTAMANWLFENDFETIALSPTGQMKLEQWNPSKRSSIVLGAEGEGLPPDILAKLDTVNVEMADGFDSLNVSTTSGIVLHHMFNRQN